MGAFTFPRSRHLKKPSEYRAAFDRGTKRHSSGFVVFRLANDLDIARLGLSVGRKIGGSVARNRVKRVVREAFRLNWRTWRLDGTDLVVVAKRGAADLSFQEASREIAASLSPRRR